MPDRLYLSLWLRDFRQEEVLDRFARLLRTFPFSRLRPGISFLKVQAIGEGEPPLLEQAFSAPPDIEQVLEMAAEFDQPDCALTVEGWWELWEWKDHWRLLPSQAVLSCYGPLFENDLGDHLRVELGLEAQFLPRPSLPQAARMARSNLRSVVRLAEELQKALPVERCRLWSDSGENFAALADAALADADD